jgi:putative toxin-antitoxin system antitoxin component (TIGR02293 family)
MWYPVGMALVEERTAEILGVKSHKGRRSWQTLRLVVDTGLRVNAFTSVVHYADITRSDLARAADIPLRTVQRREASHAGKFERDESDRLARVARLYAVAEDVLGSRENAQRWMKTPNRALDGARPLDELDTDFAAREVEDLLGRVRYGVFG